MASGCGAHAAVPGGGRHRRRGRDRASRRRAVRRRRHPGGSERLGSEALHALAAELAHGRFHAGVGDVGTGRIDRQLPAAGVHHQVHVLHGNRPQQHLVTDHQRADVAEPLAEGDSHRAYIGHGRGTAVGHRHFSHRFGLQVELAGDMLRDAQHQRPGVDQRVHPCCVARPQPRLVAR